MFVGLSGKELRTKLELCAVCPPIIVVSTRDDPEIRWKAKQINAVAFFRKPVDGTALLDAVQWAMESRRRESNNKEV